MSSTIKSKIFFRTTMLCSVFTAALASGLAAAESEVVFSSWNGAKGAIL